MILTLQHHTPFFLFPSYPHHRDLHSFPTRRSSDLRGNGDGRPVGNAHRGVSLGEPRRAEDPARLRRGRAAPAHPVTRRDRKSTRLNSSHQIISYAVFCLKKKKKPPKTHQHKYLRTL